MICNKYLNERIIQSYINYDPYYNYQFCNVAVNHFQVPGTYFIDMNKSFIPYGTDNWSKLNRGNFWIFTFDLKLLNNKLKNISVLLVESEKTYRQFWVNYLEAANIEVDSRLWDMNRTAHHVIFYTYVTCNVCNVAQCSSNGVLRSIWRGSVNSRGIACYRGNDYNF